MLNLLLCFSIKELVTTKEKMAFSSFQDPSIARFREYSINYAPETL